MTKLSNKRMKEIFGGAETAAGDNQQTNIKIRSYQSKFINELSTSNKNIVITVSKGLGKLRS